MILIRHYVHIDKNFWRQQATSMYYIVTYAHTSNTNDEMNVADENEQKQFKQELTSRAVMARDSLSSLVRLSHVNYIHMHAYFYFCSERKNCRLHTAFLPNWLAGNFRVDRIICTYIVQYLCKEKEKRHSLSYSDYRWWLLWFDFYLIMTFNAVDVVVFLSLFFFISIERYYTEVIMIRDMVKIYTFGTQFPISFVHFNFFFPHLFLS